MTILASPRNDCRTLDPLLDAQSSACCLCGATEATVLAGGIRDYEYNAPGIYSWLSCTECGLVWLDPPPSDELLGLAYPSDYQAYQPHQSRLVAWYVARRRLARARSLAAMMPPEGTVLDVGCGTGTLLAQIGTLGPYRLLGVEYHREVAETARADGATVWAGELEDADIAPASVDLIVMEHVIEHVRDPAATLQRVAQLLRPGGVLVGETPNIACRDADRFGRYWGGGHAPRHLTLFSPTSMRRAMSDQGFPHVVITHPFHPAHHALSVQNWLRRSRRDLHGLKSGRAWYYPWLCCAAMGPAFLAALAKRSGVIRFEGRIAHAG